MMNGYYVTENGRVSIAPNIVRSFVIKEVESSPYFRFSLTRGEGFGFSKRSIENSARVNFVEGRAEIALHLQVLFGTRIRLQARELQGRIVRALALGTGLEVEDITITVERVYCEPDESPQGPPTQSQNIELDES